MATQLRIRPLCAEDLGPETGGAGPLRELVRASFPYDRVDVVLREKLLGADGPRTGEAFVAELDGVTVGVVATAGRWMKLLATGPAFRARGIGSALLEHARARAAPGTRLRLLDHPGNYLCPGLDVRHHEARAFFERRGFEVVGEVENLRVPLDKNPLVTAERAGLLADRARDQGYQVCRATVTDRAPLLALIESAFAPAWAYEVGRALDGPRRAVHLARQGRDGKGPIVAFAAADGNNRGLGWFGPAGTLPEHRGAGLGEALLIPCLLDVAGLPEAGVIAWIGPRRFYEKAAGALDDRRFLTMQERSASRPPPAQRT